MSDVGVVKVELALMLVLAIWVILSRKNWWF